MFHPFAGVKVEEKKETKKSLSIPNLFHSPVPGHLQQQRVGAAPAPRRCGQHKLNADLIHGGGGGRGDGFLPPPPAAVFPCHFALFVAHLDLLPVHCLAWTQRTLLIITRNHANTLLPRDAASGSVCGHNLDSEWQVDWSEQRRTLK